MVPQWEVVRVVLTANEAELIRGFLSSRGITVETESLLFTQEPLSTGALGDVRILVPASELGEAQRWLAELESEGKSATGQPQDPGSPGEDPA